VEKESPTGLPGWVIRIGGILAAFLFLYLVRSILPPFIIGGAIAYVLSPVVDRIELRWSVPRGIAIAGLYATLLVPVVVLAVLLGPRFLEETRQLLFRTPTLLTRLIQDFFGLGPYSVFGTSTDARQISVDLIDSLRGTFGTPTQAIHFISAIAEFTLALFLSLVTSIYCLIDSERIGRVLLALFPAEQRGPVARASAEIHRTLARYLRRQGVLIAFVATITFIGLDLVFQVPYAVPVAVATGFLEVVPFLGPFVAATIAGIIAFSQGGVSLMVGVIIFYFVVRQIEDQIVMPVVLGHAVKLHPLVVIFAVLAGGALFGILGTLAAVPVAASIKVLLDYWPLIRGSPATPVERLLEGADKPDETNGSPGPGAPAPRPTHADLQAEGQRKP
jgi:predicted PurR-regulated permease PerM